MPPKTKIFVGKLPPDCGDIDLRKLFERYGEVTECSLMGNYAFIHMKTEDQAENAIQGLNNWDMHGFKISVEQSTGEKRSGGPGGVGFRGGRGGRGGGGGGFRGRGGRGMGPRLGPYDRRPPMDDRYGGPPGPPRPPMRNGYLDEYERRDRPMPPMDRRPPPPVPRDSYRDPYSRYESYERMPPPPPPMRTPPMERRPPPMGYDRREDPYDMHYARPGADMYGGREMFSQRGRSPPRRSPPRRYPGPPRGELPPRRF